MLSKAVKYRRSINRALRSMPCWRFCMQSYKTQQLTIVRLHIQHLESMPVESSASVDEHLKLDEKLQAKRKDIEVLKEQREHMTREEWYSELDKLQGHHHGQREWMRLLITNDDE